MSQRTVARVIGRLVTDDRHQWRHLAGTWQPNDPASFIRPDAFPNRKGNGSTTSTFVNVKRLAPRRSGAVCLLRRQESDTGRQPVRAHGMEDPRRLHHGHHQGHRANARRLSLAGYRIRLAAFRRRAERSLAAAARSASPGQLHLESARRARRHAVDWHFERAGELEGRQARSARGARWFHRSGASRRSRWISMGPGSGGPDRTALYISGYGCPMLRRGRPFRLGRLRLVEDSRGNLWAGAGRGLWRWKPAPSTSFPCRTRRTPRSQFRFDERCD
jgi:hypothetical protein